MVSIAVPSCQDDVAISILCLALNHTKNMLSEFVCLIKVVTFAMKYT